MTFEDQQKINKFARNTSRITELKEEIEVKKVLAVFVMFQKKKLSIPCLFETGFCCQVVLHLRASAADGPICPT